MTSSGLACAACGIGLPLNSKFCNECGTAVSSAAKAAEYKQVTVLFADVVHSMDVAAAVGPERLREIMADLADRCAAVVNRFGGTVDKFTGDGIMAVFGAPVALEDHAFRACLVALGIQEEAKQLAVDVYDRDGVDLQLRVGLNSGEVIAGEIGSGPFGYTAVGEQVGLAQRMESVAPAGGVMLSVSTARLVGHSAVLASRSSFRSRVPRRQCMPAGCSAWRNGPLSEVRSRIWSVDGGNCPLSRACWTAPPRATARWSAWWDHLVSARADSCVKFLRWRVPLAWRCSPHSANRMPARFRSMRSRVCSAQPSVSRVSTGRLPAIECGAGSPTRTPRIWCFLMTCWASPTPTLRYRQLIPMRVVEG